MAYFESTQKTRRFLAVTVRSQSFALDGVFVRQFVYTAEFVMSIRLIRACYEEATSSHTGVSVRIGKIGFPDYFANFTSEGSKAAGDVTTVTKTANRQFLAAGETLTVECDGGKTGAGILSMQIELESYR